MSTSRSNSPMILPVVTIDPSFPTVIQDVDNGIVPSETFWISCYRDSQPSVHGKIEVQLDEVDRNLVHLKPKDADVELIQTKKDIVTYSASCRPLSIPSTDLLIPVQRYLDPERSNAQRPQRITAFDVSPDSTKFASGFLDGSVFIYPVSPLSSSNTSFPEPPAPIPHSITPPVSQRLTCKAHLSNVTSLRFFPSSRVLLTAGGDFSLAILAADLPMPSSDSALPRTRITPARTLRGHTGSISSTGIIALGRNILSTSMDSTVKLWDVPSGSCITSLMAHSPILSSTIGERMPVPPDGEDLTLRTKTGASVKDEREVPETQSKLIFCGLQQGTFEMFDLREKSSVYRSPAPPSPSTASSLTAITYNDAHHLLATGSSKGIVSVYDIRSLRSDAGGGPVTTFRRNEAAIEDLEFAVRGVEVRLGIATADGLPYIADVAPEGPAVGAELVDGECDPVRCVKIMDVRDDDAGGRKLEVWSAADDAIVRRYLA